MAQTTPDTSFGPYGECIFFSFVFIDTNDCLLHIQLQIYVIWRQVEGCNDGKWPRWRRTHRLGLVVSVFFFPFIFIDTNACLLHIQLLIYILCDIETDGRLWLWERAQTTLICAIVDNVEFFFFLSYFLNLIFYITYISSSSYFYFLFIYK